MTLGIFDSVLVFDVSKTENGEIELKVENDGAGELELTNGCLQGLVELVSDDSVMIERLMKLLEQRGA